MALDISSSLKAPSMDREWFKKVIIGGIIGLIPIVDLIALGYSTLYLERILKHGQGIVLPEWTDWWMLFSRGLKVLIVLIIYSILPIILGSMGGTVLLSPGVFLPTGGILLYAVIMLVLFLVVTGLALFLLPVAIVRLVQSAYNVGTALEIKKIFYMARSRVRDYIIGCTAMSAVFIAVFMLGFIPILGWFIGVFASFYLMLSFSHMLASIFRDIPDEKHVKGGQGIEPIVPG